MAQSYNRSIAIWLFIVCAMIFVMVIVGGITRLTESGLSMVNWHPISGVVPPLSDAEWAAEFEAYKQFPEYRKVNNQMELDAFKSIFFWEFSHRLLGRLIGVAFFVPFVFFLVKKRIQPSLKPQLWILFSLGACQGLLGWWMVKSGLVDRPDVSHYRLTAHLGLAVLIYMYMLWVGLGLVIAPNIDKPLVVLKRWVALFVWLVFVQILFGGLVAGLNAGLIYNNWPWMGDSLIAPEIFDMAPWYMNFVENAATVQLDHRLLAYIITGLGVYIWLQFWVEKSCKYRAIATWLLVVLLMQVSLGILTLIYVVPLVLAVAHQGGAVITLSVAILLLRRV